MRNENDPFRPAYRELYPSEEALVSLVKRQASQLNESLLREGLPAREMALARMKLEECVMWAVKGITQ